ncbi:hypothetical protein BV898_05423 [Hypsibius exemplaris]|uniref:Endonuclease/exonuclease/phosphatase domain-containing protein n=1 Tax=Hypsibius exemplaris TaxID=2072580 RepID=A0A1W0WZH6_HYPEX|nr:hypothetical protein BV898_05423 [Hypsibius exemplaris]
MVALNTLIEYRKDRSEALSSGRKKGGGILLYVPDHVTSRELITRNIDGAESLWIICNFDGRLLLVGALYILLWATAGQTKELFAHIEDVLDQFPTHDHVLIGDLNIDLTPGLTSPYAAMINDLCSKYNMEDKVTGPTRITGISATKIDVMLCGPPASHIRSPATPLSDSDHHLCSTAATYHSTTPKHHVVSFRLWKHSSDEDFFCTCCSSHQGIRSI